MLKYTEQLLWFASVVSILGTIFNIRKQNKCFVLWLLGNGIFCVYDFVTKSYAQSFLFFIYVILAIWGLWEWRTKKGEK